MQIHMHMHTPFFNIIRLLIGKDIIKVLTGIRRLHRNYPAHSQCNHSNPERNPIPAKDLKIMLFNIIHKKPDNKHRHRKRCRHADNQDARFRSCKRKAKFHHL